MRKLSFILPVLGLIPMGCGAQEVDRGGGTPIFQAPPDNSGKPGQQANDPDFSGATPPATPPAVIDVGAGVVSSNTPPDLANGGLEELRNGSCAGWQATTEALPPVLQIVLDSSGSMEEGPDGSRRTQPSKWTLTVEALQPTLDGLSPEAAVGLFTYPNTDRGIQDQEQPNTTCLDTSVGVPLGVLGAQGSGVRSALSQFLTTARPAGRTPTHDAYQYALDELKKSTLPGKRFLLLITDGQPTHDLGCLARGNGTGGADANAIVAAVAAAQAEGFGTFVIGSPGSEDGRGWLSQAATAGGTARENCSDAGPNYCHFDMTSEPNFGEALQAALKSITGQVVSCNYPIPAPPDGGAVDPNKVNLVYSPAGNASGAVLIPRNDDPACAEGWQYGPGGQEVVLCPQTCSQVKGDLTAQVEVFGGCETKVAQIR